MHDVPRLMRTRQAATYCGLAKSTLEKLRVSGGGPQFIRHGRTVYYSVADLDEWVDSLPRFRSTSQADSADYDAVQPVSVVG